MTEILEKVKKIADSIHIVIDWIESRYEVDVAIHDALGDKSTYSENTEVIVSNTLKVLKEKYKDKALVSQVLSAELRYLESLKFELNRHGKAEQKET